MSNKDSENKKFQNKLEDLLKDIDEELGGAISEEEKISKFTKTNVKTVKISESLSLLIDDNKTKAWLQYKKTKNASPTAIKANDILNKIKENGIKFGIKEKNLQKIETGSNI